MVGSDEFIRDPFPVYREFLDRPGWRTPTGYRVFARFDDVLAILRDPATFGQETRAQPSFHQMDPPEHTRLRRLVSRAFTPRAVERRRDHITQIVGSLLDEVCDADEMEVIGDFASRLPAMVMSVLLGVPVDDGRRWRNYIEVMVAQRGLAHYLDRDFTAKNSPPAEHWSWASHAAACATSSALRSSSTPLDWSAWVTDARPRVAAFGSSALTRIP